MALSKGFRRMLVLEALVLVAITSYFAYSRFGPHETESQLKLRQNMKMAQKLLQSYHQQKYQYPSSLAALLKQTWTTDNATWQQMINPYTMATGFTSQVKAIAQMDQLILPSLCKNPSLTGAVVYHPVGKSYELFACDYPDMPFAAGGEWVVLKPE